MVRKKTVCTKPKKTLHGNDKVNYAGVEIPNPSAIKIYTYSQRSVFARRISDITHRKTFAEQPKIVANKIRRYVGTEW